MCPASAKPAAGSLSLHSGRHLILWANTHVPYTCANELTHTKDSRNEGDRQTDRQNRQSQRQRQRESSVLVPPRDSDDTTGIVAAFLSNIFHIGLFFNASTKGAAWCIEFIFGIAFTQLHDRYSRVISAKALQNWICNLNLKEMMGSCELLVDRRRSHPGGKQLQHRIPIPGWLGRNHGDWSWLATAEHAWACRFVGCINFSLYSSLLWKLLFRFEH